MGRGLNRKRTLSRWLSKDGQKQEAQALIILESLAAYVSFLKQHIHKEDHSFFPVAERNIPRDEQRGLLEAFHREGQKMEKKFLEKSKRDLYEMSGLLLR